MYNAVITTQQEKQHIWKNTLSGSQMSMLLHKPEQLWLQKKLNIEPVFSKKAKEKMRAGTDLESYVLKRFLESFAEGELEEGVGVLDKATYFKEHNGFTYSANIDANQVEIKWTEESDMDVLEKRYNPQVQYYMWFFDKDFWYLTVMVNGWELKKRKILRDDVFISNMMNNAHIFNTFQKSLEDAYPIPEFTWGDNIVENSSLRDVIFEDLSQEDKDLVLEMFKNNKKMKLCEQSKKDLSSKCLARFNTGVRIKAPYGTISTSSVNKKGNIDYKGLLEYLSEKYNFAITEDIVESFRGDDISYNQSVIRFKKGTDIQLEEDYIDLESIFE